MRALVLKESEKLISAKKDINKTLRNHNTTMENNRQGSEARGQGPSRLPSSRSTLTDGVWLKVKCQVRYDSRIYHEDTLWFT
ncbi:unnamed protein product [Gadus morhua 'NCC']